MLNVAFGLDHVIKIAQTKLDIVIIYVQEQHRRLFAEVLQVNDVFCFAVNSSISIRLQLASSQSF